MSRFDRAIRDANSPPVRARHWDAIDEQMEREGQATRRSMKSIALRPAAKNDIYPLERVTRS